jgi:hypothetical protein
MVLHRFHPPKKLPWRFWDRQGLSSHYNREDTESQGRNFGIPFEKSVARLSLWQFPQTD